MKKALIFVLISLALLSGLLTYFLYFNKISSYNNIDSNNFTSECKTIVKSKDAIQSIVITEADTNSNQVYYLNNAKLYYEKGIDLFEEAKFKLEVNLKFNEAKTKYEEAVDQFRKAIELQPDFVEAHIGLARTYFFLKLYNESASEYESIVCLRPNDPKARLDLADAYSRIKKYDDAIIQLEIAKGIISSTDPKNLLIQYIENQINDLKKVG